MSSSARPEMGLGWPTPSTNRRADSPACDLGWPLATPDIDEASEMPPPPTPVPSDGEDAVSAQPRDHDMFSDDSPRSAPSLVNASTTTAVVDDPAPPSTSATGTSTPSTGSKARTASSSATRRLIRPKGSPWTRPSRTRVVTIANQKGGVGKTTTAVNIAASLALGGQRVLVIDSDPQGNASTALGIEHSADVTSIYDVLVDDVPLLDVIQQCPLVPGLQCVPATIELAGAEIELVSFVARETRLQRAIGVLLDQLAQRGEGLDYIVIDCPPSLGLLTINAFVAGAEVLIPIQCEYYALEGLSMLIRNIEMIQRHLNPRLHISTILLTMYDGRTRLSAQVAEEVRQHFSGHVLNAMVPRSVRVSEAPSHGETVLTYDPMSTGSLAYLDAAREFAHRTPPGSDPAPSA